jgi:hypothetical protein
MAVFHLGPKAYSSWSLRPWLLAKELGYEFTEEVHPVSGAGSSSGPHPALGAVSPSGLVPCLSSTGASWWWSRAPRARPAKLGYAQRAERRGVELNGNLHEDKQIPI